MPETPRLYLHTLEVDPLIVGKVYNPLPAHLTLVSRFWSDLAPPEIAALVEPVFEQTEHIHLEIGKATLLGPNRTPVHMVRPTSDLLSLHAGLMDVLDDQDVTYTNPQWTRDGWKPHISQRHNKEFTVGQKIMTTAAYLIEVRKTESQQLRHIQHRFVLQ